LRRFAAYLGPNPPAKEILLAAQNLAPRAVRRALRERQEDPFWKILARGRERRVSNYLYDNLAGGKTPKRVIL
jgi:hypothetical protein